VQIHAGELRFGVHSGQQYSDFPGYLDLWRTAEAAGLDWASVFDHFMPIQADPAGPCFEGLGVTYRHPAVLAKMAATIDHVSGGRLELGIGAAWYELEHGQYGIPFPRIGVRMDMLDETAHILRSLWTNERSTFEGRHFTLRDAMAEPKPLQERLPLWVGGSGERRTLRIVAEHADGWNTFLADHETYQHKLDVLAAHCADVGRDPEDIRKQVVLQAVLGETEAEAEENLRERAAIRGVAAEQMRRGMIVGTPEQCAERCEVAREQGVGDFLLGARPPADKRSIELFARDVAGALRAAVA
jgi:alkanesulfonate monooxygenase SsuD/methylene tetrahydromethanopterin reductase-like flavin-dependent oxidoreductase (luciferase family)